MNKKKISLLIPVLAAVGLVVSGCSGLSEGGVKTPSVFAKNVILGEWEGTCQKSSTTDYGSFTKHLLFDKNGTMTTSIVTYGGTDCALENKLPDTPTPLPLPYATGAKTHDFHNSVSYELDIGNGDDTLFTSFEIKTPYLCLATAFVPDEDSQDQNASGGGNISPDDPNAPDPTKAPQGSTPDTRLNVFPNTTTLCYLRVSDHNTSK